MSPDFFLIGPSSPWEEIRSKERTESFCRENSPIIAISIFTIVVDWSCHSIGRGSNGSPLLLGFSFLSDPCSFFFAGCSAAWSDAPAATRRSSPRSWWCGPETWCSTCVASRAPLARSHWPRAITSGWGTARCSAGCTTRWAPSSTPPRALPSRFIPPALTTPANRSPRPNSSTITTTTHRTRTTPCTRNIPTATWARYRSSRRRRPSRTRAHHPRYPTSMVPLSSRRLDKRAGPGRGNLRISKLWPPI